MQFCAQRCRHDPTTCSSSNFCQRAQVNRKAMTAQRACARVRIVENDLANADQRMRDPCKNDEDCESKLRHSEGQRPGPRAPRQISEPDGSRRFADRSPPPSGRHRRFASPHPSHGLTEGRVRPALIDGKLVQSEARSHSHAVVSVASGAHTTLKVEFGMRMILGSVYVRFTGGFGTADLQSARRRLEEWTKDCCTKKPDAK